MDVFIYALNFGMLFSCVLDMRIRQDEKRFSLALVRILLFAPLLAGEYFYFFSHLQPELVAPIFFSESVFSLTWIVMAFRLQHATAPPANKTAQYLLILLAIAIGVLGVGIYWLFSLPAVEIIQRILVFPDYGHLFFSSLLVLMAVLIMAWRLESFWRALTSKSRLQYKYLVVGFFLICGSLAWTASYRLTYLRLVDEHFLLLAILLLAAWLFISYAVARQRLFNRKIFMSRKVVYSTVAPLIFAGYLIMLGLASLVMKTFGWPLPFILQWLLIILGLLLIVVFALFSKVRGHLKYFISTHFYVNKYEYRDEWLAFSELLRGKLTEKGVVAALREILHDSLYTKKIKIWLGDTKEGFQLLDYQNIQTRTVETVIPGDDPLVRNLQNTPYLSLEKPETGQARQNIIVEKADFFNAHGLVLMVPLTIGGQCVGLIGLGPEYTGGTYGHDDFDLLAALGSQAASALLAVRTGERLANAREQSAWDALSAFVLHDIKNAATILSLLKENAPKHIHKPEFQQDMLGSIDDTLKRMVKVQARLKTLKGEMVPVKQELLISRFLRDCCEDLAIKLPGLEIDLQCKQEMPIQTDPDFVSHIVENLLLNALEAGGSGTLMQIRIVDDSLQNIQMEFTDNGPGIPPALLPGYLFEPFKTTKPLGSGIGLWQAKRFVESLGGVIKAGNVEGSGARFVVWLPGR